MDKKIAAALVTLLILSGLGAFFLFSKKASGPSVGIPRQQEARKLPSATLKGYVDSSGFGFNYPDNLSLLKNDTKDNATYADIQLTAKEASGKIQIKIVDSKYSSVEQFFKDYTKASPTDLKEGKLGSLKAREIQEKERTLLAAVDQGVLFTIEMTPEGMLDYWTNVYNPILTSFSFSSQSSNSTASKIAEDGQDAVSFEGEETIE